MNEDKKNVYYKFVKYNMPDCSEDVVDVTFEVRSWDLTWHDMFDHFRDFLNGCSYSVPHGQWVPDEEIDENKAAKYRAGLEVLATEYHSHGKINELLTHPLESIREVAKDVHNELKNKEEEDV